MRAIYEPRGRALEYSPLACNLYTGCAHGCKYCYAPNSLKKKRDEFHADVRPRKGILEAVEKDCKRMKGDPRLILLCFHCDPYPPEGTCEDVTRPALELMEWHKMKVQVLTKGGERAIRDFDILARNKGWAFGSTIIFASEELRLKWEPFAASLGSRVKAVVEAQRRGVPTWVSVEPVVDANQALEVIVTLVNHVDLWKLGKLNHDPEREAQTDWVRYLAEVERLLKGREYVVKKDLLKAAGRSG